MTTRLALPALAVLVLAAALPSACAEWTWNDKEAIASLANGKITAQFTFHNDSKTPVTVEDVKFSCTCTESSFKATTAPAGGTGVLSIALPPSNGPDSLTLFAFGPTGFVATQLTIQIPP